MWCYTCQNIWNTDDYHEYIECPLCHGSPIYRTSSTSYFYAWLARNPEEQKKIEAQIKKIKDEHQNNS